MRQRLRFVGVVAVLLCVAAAPVRADPRVERLGTGAGTVWVLWPRERPTSIVVFGHGWSTPLPTDGFAPWLAHLRARGSIVIYPQYRTSAAEPVGAALRAFKSGLQEGFARVRGLRLPVVAIGKSFGGSAVFSYAAAAAAWHVPAPRAILSVFPALPLAPLPSVGIADKTFVELFVGEADTTAGSAGANAFWRWLAGHPAARKRYVLIRSQPGFVANHDSAQRSDAIARRIFWAPFDRLIQRARRSD
jgi:acetyl esterase/lipase